MTEKEALKLALEALKYPLNQSHENFNVDMAELLAHRAITAIKEALAQPEQEPVAQVNKDPDTGKLYVQWTMPWSLLADGTKFYTIPPQRTWVGLSVFEINNLVENTEYEDYRDLVERTEAKLKEKNT